MFLRGKQMQSRTKTIAAQLGVATLILAAGMLTMAPATAKSKWNNAGSPCERSTKNMNRACMADARDNLQQTYASCRHISNSGERNECRTAAMQEHYEEKTFCAEQRDARNAACAALGEHRYDPDTLLDTSLTFIDPDDVPTVYAPNPYVSVVAGHTFVLGSNDGEEMVVVHVTDESREILGAKCRVVLDLVFEVSDDGGEIEYEIVESTDDWFAQTSNGDVVYCGEIARNFEDGILRDLDGSFEAGIDFAKAGFLTKAMPTVGDVHRQEFALGEAEDIVKYVSIAASPTAEEGGENASFPCANQCLKTFDFAPLEPEATEYKYYLPGVGFVLAVGMEDGELTGEREELICVGESPDILEDAACGIADPEALLEELCKFAPDAFCD